MLQKSKLLEALRAVRLDFETAVMRTIDSHPEWPYWKVGQQVGLSEATVLRTAQKHNISRPVGPHPKVETTQKGGL